ncbi:unnamed protein product [Medioppia subpectinata]|uniref:Uncharacterized protein n=1 Tax=Medioppia subpectinata TaxID=1979941 RepID=A0A7R9KGP0_9ACAR|nr:unnamed protein product [Medioppia subpectinata]CAG2103009.1 unnamed protein product [Medioppia subpectinata]
MSRNFFVISCESCKAFFRRHALKVKPFICPQYDGKCDIDANTRQLCKKCRLDKCFAVGVNPKRRGKCMAKTLPTKLTTTNITETDLNEQIREIEDCVTTNTSKAYQTLDEIRRKYHEMSINPIFKGLTDYNGWNQLETRRMSELLMACQVLDYPTAKTNLRLKDKNQMVIMTTSKTDHKIRDFITFSKSLNGFADLCPTDQLALFKSGSLGLLLLSIMMCYNEETQGFNMFVDEEKSVVFSFDDFQFRDFDYLGVWREFVLSLWPILKSDNIVKHLLTAIILFNPNYPNLKHKHNVELEQQLYIYLLQRYLLLKYGSESQPRLQNLMLLLKDLHILREIQHTFGATECQQYSPYLGPLVKEIYDLS